MLKTTTLELECCSIQLLEITPCYCGTLVGVSVLGVELWCKRSWNSFIAGTYSGCLPILLGFLGAFHRFMAFPAKVFESCGAMARRYSQQSFFLGMHPHWRHQSASGVFVSAAGRGDWLLHLTREMLWKIASSLWTSFTLQSNVA